LACQYDIKLEISFIIHLNLAGASTLLLEDVNKLIWSKFNF